jgi:hypothetical protein
VSVSGACTVMDAGQGQVRYPWVTGNTTTAGVFQAEFQITWNGGKIETVPNGSYLAVEIVADLGP